MATKCMAGCDRPPDHICGRYYPGDAEPLGDVQLSSDPVQWRRCADGVWRLAGTPEGYPEYTWDELVTGFGELHEVAEKHYVSYAGWPHSVDGENGDTQEAAWNASSDPRTASPSSSTW